MKNMIILILCIISNSLNAQKIISVKNVNGEYILPQKSDVSLKVAYEKAINEAKLEALRKAGVVEYISSSDILTTDQSVSDFKQVLNSILSVELSGGIINDSIIEETSSKDQYGNLKVRVTLNADVIKYEHLSDPNFDFKIEGLKEYYENDDIMKFTFKPYSTGYLKIFNVNDAENYIIYPYQDADNSFLDDSLNQLFKAGEQVQFPINKLIGNPRNKQEGYLLSTELKKERNYLIFVFTKENIPFVNKPTYKNILTWIYKTSPERRKVQFWDFIIVNRSID